MIGMLLLYLTACGGDDDSRLRSPSVQLTVVNRKPVKLENGKVYRYIEDGSCYVLDLGDYIQSMP